MDFTKSLELAIKMPVRAGDLRAFTNHDKRSTASRRQSPRHRRDVGCSSGADAGRAEALPRVLEGRGHRRLDWSQKQFLDSIFTQKFGLRACRSRRRASRAGRARSEPSRSRRYVPCATVFLFAFFLFASFMQLGRCCAATRPVTPLRSLRRPHGRWDTYRS